MVSRRQPPVSQVTLIKKEEREGWERGEDWLWAGEYKSILLYSSSLLFSFPTAKFSITETQLVVILIIKEKLALRCEWPINLNLGGFVNSNKCLL